ncbi:hypothetical protein [Taibaiella soli]|nr:hypothetical protein [Taibaiella soli]
MQLSKLQKLLDSKQDVGTIENLTRLLLFYALAVAANHSSSNL